MPISRERLPHLLVGHGGAGTTRSGRVINESGYAVNHTDAALDRRARIGVGERVLPHRALAGELLADLVGVGQHRLRQQPGHVGAVVAGRRAVLGHRAARERRLHPRPEPQRARTGRVQMFGVGDLAGFVFLLVFQQLRHPPPSRQPRRQTAGHLGPAFARYQYCPSTRRLTAGASRCGILSATANCRPTDVAVVNIAPWTIRGRHRVAMVRNL